MKKLGSRRMAGYITLLLALVVGAVVVVASAQAAPVKKKFDAYVVATDPSSTSFKLTLVNDTSSQQTLGSANFSASGLSLTPIPTTLVVSSGNHNWTVCTGSGGVMCGDGANNTVEFRANTSGDALAPGESVSFVVSRADSKCESAAWAAAARQSNDFSGNNNLFNLAAGDLTPLGSFAFASGFDANGQLVPAPIETIQNGIHIPQIVVNKAASIKITALDTCKNLDKDYPNYVDNSTPTLNPVNGLVPTPPSTTDFSALSWSNGVGSATVTPTNVEVGDSFTINDAENGISATSSSTIAGQPPQAKPTFDVVETICALSGQTCVWKNKNKLITATSTIPTDGGGEALGLGYRSFGSTSVVCSGTGKTTPVGDIVQIDPWQYTTAYVISIVYDKSLVGNGPASSLTACKMKDGSQTWEVIPACPNPPQAECADITKVPGGNFQVTLYLNPGDPGAGGLK